MSVYSANLWTNLRSDLSSQVGSHILDLYDHGIRTWPGMSIGEASSISILESIFKKLKTSRTETSDARAVSLFKSMINRNQEWSLTLNTSLDETLVGELKSSLYRFFNPGGDLLLTDLYQFALRGRSGPGTSVGSRGNSFYQKMFSSELTSTSQSLYYWYNRYTSYFPEWAIAEELRASSFGKVRIVEDSRTSLVPKSDKISRLICVEPSLNTWFQLGAASILTDALWQSYRIDLQTQPDKNRRLAHQGSVSDDLVTIDLSSASDTLSVNLMQQIIPKQAYDLLGKLRTTHTRLPDGERLELTMFSTMGNGFTFPLQTAVFSAVVDAAFRSYGIRDIKHRSDWSVFGDDIICPKFIFGRVMRLLELIGCIPNVDKTFAEGPFRESCGHDYFLGVNIRGVYAKQLDTPQDRYSVINQLNLFSARTNIYLEKTISYLLTTVKWAPVPIHENDDSGIRVPFCLTHNGDTRRHVDTQGIEYRKYVARPSRIHFNASGKITWPPRTKPVRYNPSGLLLAFLQGSVNSGSISIRHDRVRYQRRNGVTSCWDRTPTDSGLLEGPVFWQRWNTAVSYNLNRL